MQPLRLTTPIFCLVAGFSSLALAHTRDSKTEVCSDSLKTAAGYHKYKLDLSRKWKQEYSIDALPNREGYLISERHKLNAEYVRLELPRLMHGPNQWRQEDWTFQERTYRFVDAGLKNLEVDAEGLNRVVLTHLRHNPDSNLELHFDLERIQAVENLENLRFTLHTMVMDTYEATKAYLKEIDLSTLQFLNRINSNSQVFVLFDEIRGSPWGMPVAKVKESALATIPISYFAGRRFERPTWKGIEEVFGVEEKYQTDKLPFEFRIAPLARESFRATYLGGFNLNKSCELTRYCKFKKSTPKAVMDRFLLEAFRETQNQNMETIFIGADVVTSRLFRRYGFKFFAKLPIAGGEAALEELLYLNIKTPEFRSIYATLSRQSFDVKRKKLSLP